MSLYLTRNLNSNLNLNSDEYQMHSDLNLNTYRIINVTIKATTNNKQQDKKNTKQKQKNNKPSSVEILATEKAPCIALFFL